MTLRIVVAEADWGGAQRRDVQAVVESVAASFPVFDDVLATVLVLPTSSAEDLPITRPTFRPGVFLVELAARGTHWAQFAYQFGHELCHVMADPTTWAGRTNRHGWIEEMLAETASLFCLGTMARTWAVDPPYPNWSSYSSALHSYRRDHLTAKERSLPYGLSLSEWMVRNRPALEADPHRRDDNTIVARELLPLFEAGRVDWRIMRSLHSVTLEAGMSLQEFMNVWIIESEDQHREGLRSIATLLCGARSPSEPG